MGSYLWCCRHAPERNQVQPTQFANKTGVHSLGPDWPVALNRLAKLSPVLARMLPADMEAWLRFATRLGAGSGAATPVQLACLTLASRLHWAPYVDRLASLLSGSITAATLVDACRELLLSHDDTGSGFQPAVGEPTKQSLLALGNQWGLLKEFACSRRSRHKQPAPGGPPGSSIVGPVGSEGGVFVCGASPSLACDKAQELLDAAARALSVPMRWPDSAADVQAFAGRMLPALQVCFDCGGQAGTSILSCLRNSLLLVEQRLGPGTFDRVSMAELSQWTPVPSHTSPLHLWPCHDVRAQFAMSPLLISFWASLLHASGEPTVGALLRCPVGRLCALVTSWRRKSPSAAAPNLYFLAQAAPDRL